MVKWPDKVMPIASDSTRHVYLTDRPFMAMISSIYTKDDSGMEYLMKDGMLHERLKVHL